MPALYERDGKTDANERRRSGGPRSLTAPVALASLVIALTMMLGSPGSSSADNGPNDVDVDPDSASHTVGDLVTLTAVLTAGTDAESTGQVSFYFLPGSPNDTAGAPDYTCDGSTGLCSISYTAVNAGVDVICATSRSTPDGCAEPWATDDTTSTDVVQRIVSAPTPTPEPTPTPTPTPSPTPPPPTGWSFTVSPSEVVQGTTTDFVARVGHTSSGGNTGCSIVDVATGFTVLAAQVIGTSSGQDWTASFSGNQLQIVADGGSDKISQGEWVDVAVRATANETGTLAWSATGSSTSTCTSEPSYLPGQTAWVNVTNPNPTPVPTPTPGPVTDGWQLTISPSGAGLGSTTYFALRLTDTDGSGDIGCMLMDVEPGFTILETWVTGTSQSAGWSATSIGNRVEVWNPDGSGKLNQGEWVDFVVRARADQAGVQDWSAVVIQNSDCTGDTFLGMLILPVQIAPAAATPIPTPVPTPDPIPAPMPPPPPAPAPVQQQPPPPPPPPAPTPDPTPTPNTGPSEEHVIPLSEDPNAGEPPFTPPRVEDSTPPLAAPAAPAPAPAPAGSGFVSQVLDAAADGIGRAVSPEAAAQVATTFGFPLALMMAVLLFLIVQDRVDRRDPKLHTAPRTFLDTVVRFKEEHEL